MARQWEMLKMLPSVGDGLTVAEVTSRLSALGFAVSRRTVERDLNDLEPLFSLEASAGRPQQWRAPRGVTIDGISVADALSLELLSRFLQPLLPGAITDRLQPLLTLARSKLQQQARNPLATWTRKVAVASDDLAAVAPQVDAKVLDVVQTALASGERIRASYRRSDGVRAARQPLDPLGLVLKGKRLYLVASIATLPDAPRLYPLHRLSAAERLHEPAEVPGNFDLQTFVDAGGLHFGSRELVKLEAWVSPMLARQLEDTKLSDDQHITHGPKRCRLRATVRDTWRLRWWALAKAGDFVVCAPASLKQSVQSCLEAALGQYRAKAAPSFSTS